MAVISPVPKLQFFDANGNPLAGGKLYSYAAGTTTPQATYTDAGGGTPNANPVILNSRGEASVWLDSSAYKLKLTTATDVEVWTVDNVAGAATLAQLAASGGSSLVGFLQAGSGASARTVQSKLRDVVSVKDFGAVGDGVVDDTAAFTAAQDASGFIYVPPGTYVLTNFRHKDARHWQGAGHDATIIQQGSASQPAWNITSDLTYGQLIDISLVGMTMKGHASSAVEVLRMSATTPYAIQNAEIDIRGVGGYHTLKMITTAAHEIYASRIKVTQTNSLNTGAILGGAYNQYWMHIAGSANGIAFSDSGWNSVYTQAVSDGMQEILGQNATVLNPTVESWTGTAQYAALNYRGENVNIINANLINVPAAKAPIGLTLNGGGGAPFTLIGFRILGVTDFPTYPMEIPAGNTGIISSANIQNKTFPLDAYTSDAILQQITFAGDCSTLTVKGKRYYGSATYDPPNLADGSGDTTTVTVTGAALGDYVDGVSFSNNLQSITVTAWVSATNTVSVRFQNESGGSIDLSSGTLKVRVTKL